MSTVYKIRNNRTKKIVNDSISRKPVLFFTKERAEYFSVKLTIESNLSSISFSRIIPSTFSVEEYKIDDNSIVYYEHLKRYVQEIDNKLEGVFYDYQE